MELILFLGVVVIAGSWFYFGKESRKEAVNDAARKSIGVVDETAKKSMIKLDDITKKSINEASKLTTTITQTSQSVLEKVHILKKEDVVDSYNQWLSDEKRMEQVSGIKLEELMLAFQSWKNKITADEQKMLYERAVDFGKIVRLNIAWLTDANVEKQNVELKQSLEEIMILNNLAWYKARLLQPQIELFETYALWSKDPSQGKNLEISQKLFAKMVDERMVTASPELLLAPEKKRREFIVQSVVDFSNRDLKGFMKMLQTVLSDIKPPGENTQKPLETEIQVDVIESKAAQKRVNRRNAEEE